MPGPPDSIRFPLWPPFRLRYAVADFKQHLQVLYGPLQIPVRLDLIRGLMLIVPDILGAFRYAKAGWLAEVFDAGRGFE